MSIACDLRDLDDPTVIDVWSYHAKARLAVHEARTAAELGSRVVAIRRVPRNLLVVRGPAKRRRSRRKVA